MGIQSHQVCSAYGDWIQRESNKYARRGGDKQLAQGVLISTTLQRIV